MKTQIRGQSQIMAASVYDAEIAAAADIQTSKLKDGAQFFWKDGSIPMTNHFQGGGFRVTGIADAVSGNDAVTKQQLEAAVTASVSGLDTKNSCRLGTTENIALDGSYVAPIDGIAIRTGDRILVKDQTDKTQNGIYIVDPGGWTRAEDANNLPGTGEVTAGMYTFIEEGFANKNTGWVLICPDPVTLGTTELEFVQFTGIGMVDAGNGLAKTGNRIYVGEGYGIQADADTVTIKLDGTTLTKSATGLKISAQGVGTTELADLGVTAIKLGVDVAGNGLTQEGSGALAVQADNTSIEVVGDAVRVKNGGITSAKLAATVAGPGLSGGAGTELSVNVGDGLSIPIDTIEVVLDGTTLTKSVAGIKLADLADGKILIGSATNVATAQTPSGDATISNAGVITINRSTIMRYADLVNRETPTTSDNTVYTIAYPAVAGTETVLKNGLVQEPGIANDYTFDPVTKTLTFTSTNDANDKIRISYFKA